MDILAGDIEIDLPPDEDDDPHVRVLGLPDAVRTAGAMVRQELEPHNKVTMKLDVSWTYHSHIIGKGGNTIQPVVKRTGVHQQPGGGAGLEEARSAIRELTPLIFTFTLSAAAQFINTCISDPNMLIIHVQNTYDVQNQIPVQMTVEISPQHHTFVLGRNTRTLKAHHATATKITFPDSNDISLPPLKKSTVTISGGIDNVYLASQKHFSLTYTAGALPLVLMFDLLPDQTVDSNEVSQIMQTLDAYSYKKQEARWVPVLIKGAERNAGNIYEAWRLISHAEKAPPKARIPPTYHISDAAPLFGLTCTPSPQVHPTALWGGLTTSSSRPPHTFQGSQYNNMLFDHTSSYYAADLLLRSGTSNCNNNNSIMSSNMNNNCIKPKHCGGLGVGSGVNLNSLVSGIGSMTVSNGAEDASCGTSSNSGSSLSSPAPSPRDQSPDQIISMSSSSHQNPYGDSESTPTNGMNDIDRRAPGCEKKHIEMAAQKMTSLSDYSSKKVQAAKDVFTAQEVDVNMFLTLDDTDLKELGIKIFGHRKRILMAIKDLGTKKPFFFGSVTGSSAIRETASTWD
ncbi:bicaudal C 1-like [Homarus americanus]|uniref:Bicaudal C 1-like n=1 Tax=Homarus americanus TaxID=6706 RepID=A0A8J5N831_HOMAM|nr:bicaudal C 1-like [Homarus americanus]